MSLPSDAVKQEVRKVYGAIARAGGGRAATCCLPEDVPQPRDYSPEEIASVPPGAYLGEGSGNPVRAARLRTGEVVVDLGSGAGMDVFLAANGVGPTGRVFGIDMTREMVERAVAYASQGNYPQVEFRLADIERIPLAAGVADVVLSNCVINLAPDKEAVFREVWRLLRPGGRMAISDIVRRPVGKAQDAAGSKRDLVEWCACLSGAMVEEDYLRLIRSVGFRDVRVVAQRAALTQPADGAYSARAITLVARKPARAQSRATPPSARAKHARPRSARG